MLSRRAFVGKGILATLAALFFPKELLAKPVATNFPKILPLKNKKFLLPLRSRRPTGNINLTMDMITKESLRSLHNNLVFTHQAYKQYDERPVFGGAKESNMIKFRLPNKFIAK